MDDVTVAYLTLQQNNLINARVDITQFFFFFSQSAAKMWSILHA